MHINDLYEQQAKDLLNKLCDAMGIAEEDRTRANVEAAIREIRKPADTVLMQWTDAEEVEIERH
jgi:hypothetical protein